MNCPNRVKNGQDTDFQSLSIAQLFLQPAVRAVYIGYWVDGTQAGHRPHGAQLCLAPSTPVSPVCNHPAAALHVCAYMRHRSTRHFWRSFSVQPPPFSGKERTQFSKFEVVESKYRRFNRARWQLTAKKCDQKFAYGRNSTSRSRRETKDTAP